jgi:2-C-methyl-D-erythritol 4-phosphate cytidylyltransferase
MTKAAIILAGGKGIRTGLEIPKQFVEIDGKLLIEYSIDNFSKYVDFITIVCHRDYLDYAKNIASKYKNINISYTTGGDTRQLSVRNGLLELAGKNVKYVAIHDSARPLFSAELVSKLFDLVKTKKAVIPVISVSSTIANVVNQKVYKYIKRDECFLVQTPQVFEYELIAEAHNYFYNQKIFDFTDDSQMLFSLGWEIYTIEGSEINIKITTRNDLEFAKLILKNLYNFQFLKEKFYERTTTKGA